MGVLLNNSGGPAPDEIRQLRLARDLQEHEAAAVIGVTLDEWRDWEHGRQPMDSTVWRLFVAKLERHSHEEFVNAKEGRTRSHDPSKKLRFEHTDSIWKGDVVNLRAVRGDTEVSVKVMFDADEGLIAGHLGGYIVGFPGRPSETTAVGDFGLHEMVEFLTQQIEHVELRSATHFV